MELTNLTKALKRIAKPIQEVIVSFSLVISIITISLGLVKKMLYWSYLYNWFNLGSLTAQMNFCANALMILFIILCIINGFLFDLIILKSEILGIPSFLKLSRKLFWSLLIIAIILTVIGHYLTLKSVAPLDVVTFEYMRFLICY